MANIKATGTADALVAVGQDYSLQSDVMMETGAQTDYSFYKQERLLLAQGRNRAVYILCAETNRGF